jgi:hypothetical protein
VLTQRNGATRSCASTDSRESVSLHTHDASTRAREHDAPPAQPSPSSSSLSRARQLPPAAVSSTAPNRIVSRGMQAGAAANTTAAQRTSALNPRAGLLSVAGIAQPASERTPRRALLHSAANSYQPGHLARQRLRQGKRVGRPNNAEVVCTVVVHNQQVAVIRRSVLQHNPTKRGRQCQPSTCAAIGRSPCQ